LNGQEEKIMLWSASLWSAFGARLLLWSQTEKRSFGLLLNGQEVDFMMTGRHQRSQ
jgi:hypothetical protein